MVWPARTDQLLTMGRRCGSDDHCGVLWVPADDKAESVAARLSLDAQADLLAVILRLTLPKVSALSWKLTALGGILRADDAQSRYGAGFEIAQAIDALIGANYPPSELWEMTPDRSPARSTSPRGSKERKRNSVRLRHSLDVASHGT